MVRLGRGGVVRISHADNDVRPQLKHAPQVESRVLLVSNYTVHTRSPAKEQTGRTTNAC